jgi:hypothetical protein
MTPRLRANRDDRSWVDVFSSAPSMRKLRVMADAELLSSDKRTWDVNSLIAGLLTDESIELFRYSDDGPPAGATEISSPWTRAAVGWAVATEQADEQTLRSYRVVWSDGQTIHSGGFEAAVGAAIRDTRSNAYREDPSRFTARRSADAVAAGVARSIKADIYLTAREYLHQVEWPLGRNVTICSQRDATALVGLYLRTRGVYVIWKDPASQSSYQFNKGLFYWVGARELLPAAWRWFHACVFHDAAEDAEELSYLGGAVLHRVARALVARDDLLRAMNRRQDNDVADDALSALDTCLLLMMGAIDAAARVAHVVLGLPSENVYQAGWQRSRWLRNVAAVAPGLAAVVAEGTSSYDALTILRLLRNTVHGAGLQSLAVGVRGGRDQTLVGLPRADGNEILAAADRRGGRDAWGLRELIPGRLHADPGVLLETLLPATIKLLNEVMRETPVENLSHVVLTPQDSLPPSGHSEFGERERQSIRWQLGM